MILIIELDEDNILTFVKNKHNFQFPLYKVGQHSKLVVKLILKCDQLEEGEGLIFPQKNLKHIWYQGGGVYKL